MRRKIGGENVRGLRGLELCARVLSPGPKARFSLFACAGRRPGLPAQGQVFRALEAPGPIPAMFDGAAIFVSFVCSVEGSRKEKDTPEIRGSIKRLWIRASAIQGLPLYPLYRCAVLAVCDSHFRRYVPFQTTKYEHRCALSSLPANQSTSFKGRAAQQTEHREAMTKPGENGQIELARIWLLFPGFISP